MVSKPNLHSNTLCQSWLDSALLCLTAQAVPRLQWPQPLCPAGSAPWGWAQTQPCTEPAAELCWGKTAHILVVCYKIPAVSVSLFSSPAIMQEQLSTQIALSLGLKAKQTQLAHTAAPSYECFASGYIGPRKHGEKTHLDSSQLTQQKTLEVLLSLLNATPAASLLGFYHMHSLHTWETFLFSSWHISGSTLLPKGTAKLSPRQQCELFQQFLLSGRFHCWQAFAKGLHPVFCTVAIVVEIASAEDSLALSLMHSNLFSHKTALKHFSAV